MIVTTRLLTTGSVVCAVISRNVHFGTFQQEFKIVNTTDSTLRQSILRSLRKSSSLSEILYYPWANSIESMPSRVVHQETKHSLMEPLLNCCKTQKNFSPVTRDISSHLREGKIIPDDDSPMINSVNNIELDSTMGAGKHKWQKASMTKQKYKSIRGWRPIATGVPAVNSQTHFIMRILSYNILAQNLLEGHQYLYREHDRDALNWHNRMALLQHEILRAEANVICLQEMQVDHLEEFLIAFKKTGYDYLYKKRTNDKRDGLLLLYRADQLNLVDYAEVELYQSDIDILNRDNVALIAKFSLIESPETHVIISTTHLLYNPRRDDVRLAQTQLLFAELERIAFKKMSKNGPRYYPIILCGDFNLQPHTGVYKFITEGTFEYKGRGRNLEPALLCGLGNTLIPPRLLVTDNCQHFDLLIKRLRGEGDDTTMLDKFDEQTECSSVLDESKNESRNNDKVNTRTFDYQNVKIVEGQYAKFSSGALTHPFELNSLYQHANNEGEAEATTHQEKWVTVDYIFYSDVEPIEKYNLPTVNECKNLPTIPNKVIGSDHLCLGASFKLKKTKR